MSAIRDRIATLADNFTAGIAADRICDQFIVIDREEVPKVEEGEPRIHVDGADYALSWRDPRSLREAALSYLAAADYFQAIRAEESKVALSKRRDELSLEFTAVSSYGGQLPYTQKLIDRIIELEQAQS